MLFLRESQSIGIVDILIIRVTTVHVPQLHTSRMPFNSFFRKCVTKSARSWTLQLYFVPALYENILFFSLYFKCIGHAYAINCVCLPQNTAYCRDGKRRLPTPDRHAIIDLATSFDKHRLRKHQQMLQDIAWRCREQEVS